MKIAIWSRAEEIVLHVRSKDTVVGHSQGQDLTRSSALAEDLNLLN